MMLTSVIPSIIVALIVVGVVICAIISIIKKKGKCSCGCEACPYNHNCKKIK